MRIHKRHFPYPVLSFFSNDFPDGEFTWTPTVEARNNTYKIEASFGLQSRVLREMLVAGKASYTVHVECPQTFYRDAWQSSECNLAMEIDSDLLDGPVELCAFIIAQNDVSHYTSEEFHPSFEKEAFSIKAGDILAVGPLYSFSADKFVDPSVAVSSIFSITANTQNENPPAVSYDLATDTIVIMIRKDQFRRFKRLQEYYKLPEILSSIVLMPVLVSILEMYIRNQLGDFKDKRWFRVLKNRLTAMEIEEGDEEEYAVEIAQTLIGDPLDAGLERLEAILIDDV